MGDGVDKPGPKARGASVSPGAERRAPHSEKPLGSRRAVLLMMMGCALFLIGRTTGSGWIVVICAGVAAALVVGALWPLVGVRRVVLVVGAPRDGTVGRPLALTVTLAGRNGAGVALRTLDPTSEWVRAAGGSAGEVTAIPSRRGVVNEVKVEIRTGGPLGLMAWSRRVTAALDRALEVGPAPHDWPISVASLAGAPGDDPERLARHGSDLVRSVRDYRPGDSPRLVHWPATARKGSLMVKELEDPERPRITIVVDMRGTLDEAEEAASRAAGLAADVLRAGLSLILVTSEPAGGVVASVATPRDVGRRLARAVAGRPSDGPFANGSVVVRVCGTIDPATVAGPE